MANATISTYNSELSWSSTASVTNLDEDEDTRVTNSSGAAVYWWTGTGNSPGTGGTQLDNTAYHDFEQGDDDLFWSFSDQSSGNTPPKVTLKVAGKNNPGTKRKRAK